MFKTAEALAPGCRAGLGGKLKGFLQSQAERHPVRVEPTRVSYDMADLGGSIGKASSELLETLYLGRRPEDTVVMDRSTALAIESRLSGLEEELGRLRRRLLAFKLLAAASSAVALVLALHILVGWWGF